MTWIIGIVGVAVPFLLYNFIKTKNEDFMNLIKNCFFFFPPNIKNGNNQSIYLNGSNQNIKNLKYHDNYLTLQFMVFVSLACSSIIFFVGLFFNVEKIIKNYFYLYIFFFFYFVFIMIKIKIKERPQILNENLIGIGFAIFYLLIIIGIGEKTNYLENYYNEYFKYNNFFFHQLKYYQNSVLERINIFNYGKFIVFILVFLFINLEFGYLISFLSTIRKINKDIKLNENKKKNDKTFSQIIKFYKKLIILFNVKVIINLLMIINISFILKKYNNLIFLVLIFNIISDYFFLNVQFNKNFGKSAELCLTLEQKLNKKIKSSNKKLVSLKESYLTVSTVCKIIYQDSIKSAIIILSKIILLIFFFVFFILISRYQNHEISLNKNKINKNFRNLESLKLLFLNKNQCVKNERDFYFEFDMVDKNKEFVKSKLKLISGFLAVFIENSKFFFSLFYIALTFFDTLCCVVLIIFIHNIKY